MSSEIFDQLKQLLKDDGMPILHAMYHPNSFGSWYITVDTQPPRRIVWDGRDSRYYIQEEIDKLFADVRDWKDISFVERAEQLSLSEIVTRLRNDKNH